MLRIFGFAFALAIGVALSIDARADVTPDQFVVENGDDDD